MIGIAITTHARRELLARILPSVRPTVPPDSPVFVVWDGPTEADVTWALGCTKEHGADLHFGPRMGVAANRNRAVMSLLGAGADWLVFIEDDVMPLRRGWADLMVAAADATGQACVSRVPTYSEWPLRIRQGEQRRERVPVWRPEWIGGLEWPESVEVVWNTWATATVQAISREAFDRVGLYDESFGLYGHEHTEWQMRLHAAGLVDRDGHPHLAPECVASFVADVDAPPSYAADYGPEWRAMIEANGSRLSQLASRHARYRPR